MNHKKLAEIKRKSDMPHIVSFSSLVKIAEEAQELNIIVENFDTEVRKIMHYEECTIFLREEEKEYCQVEVVKNSSRIQEFLQFQLEEGLIDWIMEDGRRLTIPDPFESMDPLKNESHSFYLLYPLQVMGKSIGIVIFHLNEKTEDIEPEILDTIGLLIHQIKAPLQHIFLYEKLNRKILELTTFLELTRSTSTLKNLKELLITILRISSMQLESDTGFIFLYDAEEDCLIPYAAKGLKQKDEGFETNLRILGKFRIKNGYGVNGWVFKNKKPLLIESFKKDRRFRDSKEFKELNIENTITIPIWVNKVPIGTICLCNKKGQGYLKHDFDLLVAMTEQIGVSIHNVILHQNLQETYVETIAGFIRALEAKDPYTSGHSERVTEYSVSLARAYGLPDEQVEIIRYAATLHDVGKIGITDNIIKKSMSLTEEEYDSIKAHPVIGEKIVSPITFLEPGLSIIRNHHERYDGKGYPDRLQGEQIPLFARICQISDTFDAITTTRPYRKGSSFDQAFEILQNNRGTQFDPDLVDLFVETIKLKIKQ